MKIITENVIGDLEITKDSQYNSIIGETVTVSAYVMVRFYGVINNLILRKGSTVYLHGKLHGNLTNEGGILYVFNSVGEVEKFDNN